MAFVLTRHDVLDHGDDDLAVHLERPVVQQVVQRAVLQVLHHQQRLTPAIDAGAHDLWVLEESGKEMLKARR